MAKRYGHIGPSARRAAMFAFDGVVATKQGEKATAPAVH
jgi:hypothetical protein